MKRLVSAVIIAGLFLALSCLGENYSVKLCGEFMQSLDSAAEKIIKADYEQANEILLQLKNQWNEKTMILNIISGGGWPFVAGRDIDAIRRDMADKNYAYALVLIRECQSCLESAIRGKKLSFDNIL